MSVVETNLIMIYGGFNDQYLSDGVIFDTDKKKVTQTFSAQNLKFDCSWNR